MDRNQRFGATVAVIFIVACLGSLEFASMCDPAERQTVVLRGVDADVFVHTQREAVGYGYPGMHTEIAEKDGEIRSTTRTAFPRRGIVSYQRRATEAEVNLFRRFYR